MQDHCPESKIEECAVELIGEDFKFREGQLQAVKFTVDNAVSGLKHTLLEAPTGSGKSMIALISAYVLWKVYEKKSYILVSDLSLYAQYENDIAKLKQHCFGCIKGKENYTCWKNGCNVSQAQCSLSGAGVASVMFKRDSWPCKRQCRYMLDYVKAVHAPITLMTYQLYFIQRNYVEDMLFNGKNTNFPMRDLVICDECHKICEICQTHFAPVISMKRPSWMTVLDKWLKAPSSETQRLRIVMNMTLCDTNDELMALVKKYEQYVAMYTAANTAARSQLAEKSKLSKAERAVLTAGNYARQEHCKLEDFLKFINEVGSSEYAVMTSDAKSITLNFVFDDVMLKKYLHAKSKCEMLMSATIGDFNEYAKLAGLDKKSCRAFVMDSTFDFSKSPVLFSRSNKMSYDEKDKSIIEISKQAAEICRENNDVRGIVQTGSYANLDMFAKSLPEETARRLIMYKNAAEKKAALAEFLERSNDPNDNSILAGPTLIEGLNFPDSLCRFQICIKVPYACLGSEYVKRKMEYVDGWYEYDVVNKLCQGIGRGVRHKTDWCKTYILDGCISWLVRKLERIGALRGRFKEISC